MLGLPDGIRACLFDLDGVLTRTATVHAAAWKEMFDEYLRRRSEETGEPFVPFDIHADYDRYVDGKRRADGVRAFLASREITLPEGTGTDPPMVATVHGLANRKNELTLGGPAKLPIPPQPKRARPRQPSGREPARRIPPG